MRAGERSLLACTVRPMHRDGHSLVPPQAGKVPEASATQRSGYRPRIRMPDSTT